MRTLTLYLLQQASRPLLLVTLLITGLIWALYSLRILDDILLYTHNPLGLFHLSLLLIPTVLTLSIPFALVIALLYLFNHLSATKETVVMITAGISPWQIARPLLFLATALTVLLLFLNLYASPTSGRLLRTQLQDLKHNALSFSLQTGVLHNVTDNITVFLRDRSKDGNFYGLFLHDSRNPQEIITYTAKNASLSPEHLVMFDGNVQFSSPSKETVAAMNFHQYTYNLTNLRSDIAPNTKIHYRHNERYLWELFNPDPEARRKKLVNRFAVTGHQRLVTPFHTFAYTLIVLAFLLPATHNRRQRSLRTALATITVLGFYLLHMGLSYLALHNLLLSFLIYLLPFLTILVGAFALSPAPPR